MTNPLPTSEEVERLIADIALLRDGVLTLVRATDLAATEEDAQELYDAFDSYADFIRTLDKRVRELEAALVDLQTAEREYRTNHDLHGDGDMRTGQAWDRMRRSGDRARSTLGHGEG